MQLNQVPQKSELTSASAQSMPVDTIEQNNNESEPLISVASPHVSKFKDQLDDSLLLARNIEQWGDYPYCAFEKPNEIDGKTVDMPLNNEQVQCQQARIKVSDQDQEVLKGLFLTYMNNQTNEHTLFILWQGTENSSQARADLNSTAPAFESWCRSKDIIMEAIEGKITEINANSKRHPVWSFLWPTVPIPKINIILSGHSLGGCLAQLTMSELTKRLDETENYRIKESVASIHMTMVNSPGMGHNCAEITQLEQRFDGSSYNLLQSGKRLYCTIVSTDGDAVEGQCRMLARHGHWTRRRVIVRPRKAASALYVLMGVVPGVGVLAATALPVTYVICTAGVVLVGATTNSVSAHKDMCISDADKNGITLHVEPGQNNTNRTLLGYMSDQARTLWCWEKSVRVYDSEIDEQALNTYIGQSNRIENDTVTCNTDESINTRNLDSGHVEQTVQNEVEAKVEECGTSFSLFSPVVNQQAGLSATNLA